MDLAETNLISVRLSLIMTFLCVLTVLLQSPVYGHNPGQSYTYLKIYDDKITGRFEIILEDLNRALSKDTTEPSSPRIAYQSIWTKSMIMLVPM